MRQAFEGYPDLRQLDKPTRSNRALATASEPILGTVGNRLGNSDKKIPRNACDCRQPLPHKAQASASIGIGGRCAGLTGTIKLSLPSTWPFNPRKRAALQEEKSLPRRRGNSSHLWRER